MMIYLCTQAYNNFIIYQIMVVDMSFTKKVKTGNCKILIIAYIFFVNLLLMLTNEMKELTQAGIGKFFICIIY